MKIEILRYLKQRGGEYYYRLKELFGEDEITDLLEKGLIQISSLHSVISLHPNVELVLDRFPSVTYEKLLSVLSDPNQISSLWESP